jgi:hypothetical protein
MGWDRAQADASEAAREARGARHRGGPESARSDPGSHGPLPGTVRSVLSLQSTAGNNMVTRLIELRRSNGRVVQRIRIKGKPTRSWSTFLAFQKTDIYGRLIPPLIKTHGEQRVEFHLKQLFSVSPELSYENEQHFAEALTYDVENKSMPGEEHTLQEQYMTLYGWKKRAEAKKPQAQSGGRKHGKTGKAPAKGGETRGQKLQPLKVYRTMELDDWNALEKGDHGRLSGHLGDFKQAQNYLYRKSPEPKVLVQFTLRPGAERVLFSTAKMAFPKVPGALKVPNIIKGTLIKEGSEDAFAEASVHEGTAPNLIGVKSEGGEAGFSLGIGGGTSPAVFMALVEEMKVLGRSQADPTAEKDADEPSSATEPASEEESPARSEPQERLKAFLDALSQVPKVIEPTNQQVEEHDPSHQYVQGSGEKGARPAPKPTRFELSDVIQNEGGGDCLFHALAGRNLTEAEMLVERQVVAAMREGMPDNQALNALNVAAALSQTSPEFAGLALGRHNIPNSVYRLLQAVPGMYAGEDELQQWCMRYNQRVTVIDATAALDNGALVVFSPEGRTVVPVTEADMYHVAREWGRRTLVLFKTPGHWERVRSIDR